ncbi:hypothetical protein HWV62_22736 [Athelia sp. TMB]|nr:hypothetical protein HWV62_22736 [Athelia sp. TMB]
MMVLAHAVRDLSNDENRSLFPSYSSEDIMQLPLAFYQASMMALEVGKCDVVPQIRHIQTVLLCVPFLFAFMDGTAWRKPGQWCLAQATTGALATELPQNLNDEDLLDVSQVERPSIEFTHSTVPRVGSLMGIQVRKYMQACQHGGEMTYPQVLQFDAAMRRVLDQLPSPLIASLSREGLNCIHNRLLRAHRRFMMRGYSDDGYQESTLRSIECAKSVVAGQRILTPWPALRPWFSKAWILRAALVLTVDWAVSIDRAHPAELVASKRLYVSEVLDLFIESQAQDNRPDMSAQCARIIEALLNAGDQRAALRPLKPSCDGASPQAKEIQIFFDGVSASLLLDGASPQNTGGEVPDLSIFNWFQSNNSGTSEQSDEMTFNFSMIDAWDGGYDAPIE